MNSRYHDPLLNLVRQTYSGICENDPNYLAFRTISPSEELLDIHLVKNLDPNRILIQIRLAQIQYTLRKVGGQIPIPPFNPQPEQLHVAFFPEENKEDILQAYTSLSRVIDSYTSTIANALHSSNKLLVLDFLYTGILFEDPNSKEYASALQMQAQAFKKQKEAVFSELNSTMRSHRLKARKGAKIISQHPLGKYFVPTEEELQKTLQKRLETSAPHGTLFESTL